MTAWCGQACHAARGFLGTCVIPARSPKCTGSGNSTSNLTSNLSSGWAKGCGTGGSREGPRARAASNTWARQDPEVEETHREGQARSGRGAGGGLGSSGAGTALGREVFLLPRGRGTAEDNQDWGSGPPPRGTQGQRHH